MRRDIRCNKLSTTTHLNISIRYSDIKSQAKQQVELISSYLISFRYVIHYHKNIAVHMCQ